MTKVTNTGSQPLVLSNGTFLAPGVETEVDGWADEKKNKITKFQLDAGTLSLDGPDEEVADLPPVDMKKVESDKKDQMIALLKELGIQADKRSSVESLESQLIKAQQEASKDEPTAV